MSQTLEILAKALASGGLVWLLVRSVDGAPARITALVISLPMVLGAGFVAMAGSADNAFVRQAALASAQAMPGLIVFATLAARFFDRLPAVALTALGCAGWAVTAWVLTIWHWSLGVSVAVFVGVMALSHLVFPIRAGFPAASAAAPALRRRAWPVAVQAGLMVLVLSLTARALGPRLSALVAAIPVAMIVITLDMRRRNSPNWRPTLQSARLGYAALLVYAMAVALLAPQIGGMAATLVAFLPALAATALTITLRTHLTESPA